MPITNRRKGYYPRSKAEANLRFALGRLRADWRTLSLPELESYLRHIIIAERKCMPQPGLRPEPPTNRWIQPRLRRRRLAAIESLVVRGGRVGKAAAARVLPRSHAWPGVMALVGKGATDVLAIQSTG